MEISVGCDQRGSIGNQVVLFYVYFSVLLEVFLNKKLFVICCLYCYQTSNLSRSVRTNLTYLSILDLKIILYFVYIYDYYVV